MGKVDVLKETTPLSSEDCFLVMQRPKSGFNFPLHVHMEFELNYLCLLYTSPSPRDA